MAKHTYQRLLLVVVTLLGVQSALTVTQDECKLEIAESMPDKMNFSTPLSFQPKLTHEALIELIVNAKSTLRIASFYWTLSAEPEFSNDPTTEPGKKIMDAIIAAAERGVNLQVILDKSNNKEMNNEADVKKLESIGVVRYLNMKQLLDGGVLHSKFLIADNKTFYIGSSNFDWRSYTQIKEIGVTSTDCSVLAEDLDKIFRTYMLISEANQVPSTLPEDLKTNINIDHPINLKLDQLNANLFLASSPPAFNGVNHWTGRTDDIDGLLQIIDRAEKYIDISVMNYSPRIEFVWPKKYWPRIDNALRRAATDRRVRVRLLFSDWSHSSRDSLMWYKSLNDIQSETLKGGGIFVKMFKVPTDDSQKNIPYARVKHDKYMVTDNGLYIGTSNWSADYFLNTCGVSVIIQPTEKNVIPEGSIIRNMQELFERDFTSEFSHNL